MKNWIKGSVLGLTLAVTSVLGGAAEAATATFTSTSPGFSPSGADAGANGFEIGNNQGFSFDFSLLNFSSITSIVLDVVYKRTNDGSSGQEAWQGTVSSGGPSFNLAEVGVVPTPAETLITLMSGDAGFAGAVNSKTIGVTFATSPSATDSFFLKTACVPGICSSSLITQLTIDYVEAVPLPAGGVLLLTGLGGIMLVRRRKA
jgi:hypothetical protein